MQYQSFRGADLKEALSQVKATLGPNALIESTKQVSNGRGGGLGHSYVEVTAAAPAGLKWPFASSEGNGAELPQKRSVRRSPSRTEPVTAGITGQLSSERRAALRTGSVSTGRDPAEIERELANLRAMLDELNQSRPPRERALAMLHSIGIEGPVAREIASGAGRAAKRGREALREWLAGRLKERLRFAPSLIAQPGQRVIACVGPTGVGKTTTLAKLAARARLDLGRRVGVVSLDTFRVGAVEQWQRYSTLMGIPFQVAHDAASFSRAVANMPAEIVLVDTAGRSNARGPWPIAECAREVSVPLHVLLVLPAWLRASDAERVLELYDDPLPTELIITKLDETVQAGGVLHAALPNQTPIAYLCNGPRVPEDIQDATSDTVIRAVFPAET